MVSLIYKHYKDEIENMMSLKMLTDCQFVDTVKIIRAQCIVYFLLMIVPFIVQLYTKNGTVVVWCIIPMTVMNVFLLCLEILQVRQLTWNIYKRDKWNFVELASIILTFVYMGVRLANYNVDIVPNENDNKKEARRIQYWVIFNSLIFGLQVMKMLYFMRVSINLAKIVKLTMRVFYDVAAFTVYLIIWITVFLQIYLIAGIYLFNQDSKKEKYAFVVDEIALWI